MKDIVQLLLLNSEEGVTVREAQNELNISAKSALNLLQHFGRPHKYKGSGISYILKETKEVKKQIDVFNNCKPFEVIRQQILSWMLEGNVDIEAWALDPLKRPPSYFVKDDSAIKLFTNTE